MTRKLEITPDTQETREAVFFAVMKTCADEPPEDYSLPLNGKIEYEVDLRPDSRSVVFASFNGELIYTPYFDALQEVLAQTRTDISLAITD